jgi:glycosyltransferase involved in cell wall biosynthesis
MTSTKQPLISVVLCFYNEEKFLKEAIDSVMNQDYENWELILVDDGSSDNSTNIACKFANEHPDKILYLEHPHHANRGLSASRNVGIKKTNGEFVAFIDADDVWLPEKLSEQIKIFDNNPEVTVILEASEYWRSWNSNDEQDIIIPIGAKEGVYSPPNLMTTLYPLGKGSAPCPSGIMARKVVFRRCSFEENFRGMYQMYEDQAFLCKVYLKETVYVSEASHNRYRQRPSSLVSSVHHSGNYHLVRKFYLNWFQAYLTHHPVEYKEVNKLLSRALASYRLTWFKRMRSEVPRLVKSLIARLLVKLGFLKYHKSW